MGHTEIDFIKLIWNWNLFQNDLGFKSLQIDFTIKYLSLDESLLDDCIIEFRNIFFDWSIIK